ncbi:unnamed protein product, partial [Pylaiella littoralis]
YIAVGDGATGRSNALGSNDSDAGSCYSDFVIVTGSAGGGEGVGDGCSDRRKGSTTAEKAASVDDENCGGGGGSSSCSAASKARRLPRGHSWSEIFSRSDNMAVREEKQRSESLRAPTAITKDELQRRRERHARSDKSKDNTRRGGPSTFFSRKLKWPTFSTPRFPGGAAASTQFPASSHASSSSFS